MPSLSRRVLVAVPGYPSALSHVPIPAARVAIQALKTNTQDVHVGASDVLAAIGSQSGIALAPGEIYTEQNVDLAAIYVDSRVANEGVGFLAFT